MNGYEDVSSINFIIAGYRGVAIRNPYATMKFYIAPDETTIKTVTKKPVELLPPRTHLADLLPPREHKTATVISFKYKSEIVPDLTHKELVELNEFMEEYETYIKYL